MLYACSSLGNILNRMAALAFCWSFHFDLCMSMMWRLRAMTCGLVSPFSILSGSHAPTRYFSALVLAAFRLARCSLIALFSSSRTCQRQATLIWSTASATSCCTWKRSLTSVALVKAVLTVSIMAEDRSVVTVLTMRRTSCGTFISTPDTVSVATPRTIAANAPLPPWAALFVSTV